MRIMEKRKNNTRSETQKKYILPGDKEVHWKFSSYNYLCKHRQNHKRSYPKSMNDDSLQHDKSHKRIEDTTWITKGKLAQLDNQAPCWTRSKEEPSSTQQRNWRPPKTKLSKNSTQTTRSPQAFPPSITRLNNLLPKKLDKTESPHRTPQKRYPWKKESNKHKPQISLIETENKFELMETESQESPLKQRNPKYSKSLKIRSKSLETFEIWIQPNENTKH